MHTLLCKCVEINQKIKKNHKCNLCPKNNDSIILSHVSYAKELIFFMLKFTQLFNVPFDPKIKQIDTLLQILWIKESRETISLAFFFVVLASSHLNLDTQISKQSMQNFQALIKKILLGISTSLTAMIYFMQKQAQFWC